MSNGGGTFFLNLRKQENDFTGANSVLIGKRWGATGDGGRG